MRRLLLVDSDRSDCGRLTRVLQGLGYSLDVTFNADGARMLNERQDYSWSVITTPVDGGDALTLFHQLRSRQTQLRGLLVTREDEADMGRAAGTAGLDIASRPIDVNVLVPWLARGESGSLQDLQPGLRRQSLPRIDKATVQALSEQQIRNRLPDADLIQIIRAMDYPFAGKDRLESFDRDTLVRVVLLIKRWCASRR